MLSKKIIAFSTGVALTITATAQVFALSPIDIVKNVSENTDGTIKVDMSYDYSSLTAQNKLGAMAVAAVYDENGVLKEIKTENLTPQSELSEFTVNVANTAGYKVKTFLWKASTMSPIASSSVFTEEELEAALPTPEPASISWNFEDGTGVETTYDFSQDSPQDVWTFATGYWDSDNSQEGYYEDAYPKIIDIDTTAPEWTADWIAASDTNYWNIGGTNYAAPGSTKCIEFTPGVWGQNIAAIRVKLSNTELEPGKQYKVSMYTRNNCVTHAIYSTLSTTTKVNAGDNYIKSDGTPNLPWANNVTASPVAYSNAFWTPCEFMITPSEENFDADGYTNLWLAFTREFNSTDQLHPSGTSSAGAVRTPDKFWIDDIKITECTETHPLEWTFENADADIGQGSELGKWASATSHKYGNSFYLFPIAQSDVLLGIGANGDDMAPGSTKCLKLSTKDQWCEKLSVKVKVSKDQLIPGKSYKLSLRSLIDFSTADGMNPYNSIYVSLQPTTVNSNFGLYHEKNKSILPWVFTGRDATSGYATGRLEAPNYIKPNWNSMSFNINPQESDFDNNGYANLWLTFTDSNFYANEGADCKMAPGNDIYLDDITITEITDATVE